MRVLSGTASISTAVMLAGQDPSDDALLVQQMLLVEQSECHETPVDTTHPEVLCSIVKKAILLLQDSERINKVDTK